jgi:translation initiation factor 2 subunit 1
MVQDPDAIFQKLQDEYNDGKPIEVLTDEVRDAIVKNIKRRMTPQPLKIRADVELTCFSYDGVLHIQASPFACNAQSHCSCYSFKALRIGARMPSFKGWQ